MQFHKGFTFRDAAAIVPYLAELGVTHLYASPYLRATPGSTHGYDVIDHSRLNPEVGTPAEYDAWVDALKRRGMSHILDIVPNHVGVATNDNKWWNDVLEHGPASRYAPAGSVSENVCERPWTHRRPTPHSAARTTAAGSSVTFRLMATKTRDRRGRSASSRRIMRTRPRTLRRTRSKLAPRRMDS